jgi:hypothetical protein
VLLVEFDHPDVFDTSSRASHIITKAEFVSEKNLVAGDKITKYLLGKESKALIDDGCPIFVSSRQQVLQNLMVQYH